MIFFDKIEKKLIKFFVNIELERNKKKYKEDKVLPDYVLKRHIKFITNGIVVFDSNDYVHSNIPISIQYSIKRYGYPRSIKPNNKTPLIYNITSNVSSIFPNEEEQNYYFDLLNN